MSYLATAAGRLDLCCPARYRIVVQGQLDASRAAWFDAQLETVGERTVLTSFVADQAALHGVLCLVRDLGLPLIEVRWLAPDVTDSAVTLEGSHP